MKIINVQLIYLIYFIILGIPLASSPPEYWWCGGQVTGMVLIMRLVLGPLVGLAGLLLLHLDWPHLTVQRQWGHS